MDRTELLSLDKDSEDYISNSHNLYRKIHINEFKMWEDGKIHHAVFPKDKMMEGYSVDWSAVVNPLESFKMKTKSCPEGDRTLDTHGLL